MDDIVDEVGIPHTIGLVYHTHIVKDIVLAGYELEKDHAYGPDVRVIGLILVVQDRLDGHIRLCADLVVADCFQTLRQSLVYFYRLFDGLDARGVSSLTSSL